MSKLEMVGYICLSVILFSLVPADEVPLMWALAYAVGGALIGVVTWVLLNEQFEESEVTK